LKCRIRDFEDENGKKELVNATAITLTIIPKTGAPIEKTMVDITHQSLGLYYYDYTPESDAVLGTYGVDWDVEVSGIHRKKMGYIIVTR
jgi:uncharacterized protein YfaS (alpha-2-macroglobulin family)